MTPRPLREDRKWPAIRRAFLRTLPEHPDCHRCGLPILGDIEIDHDPPYSITGNHDRLFPSHPSCNKSAGGRHGVELARAKRAGLIASRALDQVPGLIPFDVGDPAVVGLGGPESGEWSFPWLRPLLDVPGDATWPRLMTAVHPRAYASLGGDFAVYAEQRMGRPLFWWQRLVAARLLEVDIEGRLVWESALLSLARQLGKSWLVRELCGWRLTMGDHFGEPQEIVHIAKEEGLALDLQRTYRLWARQRPDRFKVRESNGSVSIEYNADGSRWLVKAARSVYGLSASMAVGDEAWAIRPSVIADGLEPTMLERTEPQLLLISTAHRQATGLMLDRRADALAQLADPHETLMIEWSASPLAGDEDESGWREASPRWTPKRERFIRDKLTKARAGVSLDEDEPDPLEAFRAQYLNRWPATVLRKSRGNPLLPDGLWDRLQWPQARERDGSPIWIAIEDNFGEGAAAVAAVETDDSRLAVWGQMFDGRVAALDWAQETLAGYELATLLLGASLIANPAARDVVGYVKPVGTKEFRTGLALFRSIAKDGRVTHDGGVQLRTQVEECRVVDSPAWLTLVGGSRSDLLRCLVWAVQESAYHPMSAPNIN